VLEITIGLFATFMLIRTGLIYFAQQQGLAEAEIKKFMNGYSSIEEIVCYAYTIIIYILSLNTFYGRRNLFKMVLEFDDLKWIRHFMNLAAMILSIWLIAILMSVGNGAFSSPEIYYPLRLSTTVLIYWIGFKGFFRIRIKEDRIELRANIKKQIKTENKEFEWEIEEIGEPKSDKKREQFERVNDYVIQSKLYLDPSLSLDSLAERAQLSSGYLSSMINTFSKNNFSDYINEFRVEHVKRLINDPDFKNYTVVSIGLESGFNSKSTFYKAFKKFTNMTPVEFRRIKESA
jgi:AraC-like DNA-binding protein